MRLCPGTNLTSKGKSFYKLDKLAAARLCLPSELLFRLLLFLQVEKSLYQSGRKKEGQSYY